MNEPSILFDKEEISEWAYEYCLNINDDPEVRKYITDSLWAYLYCRDIKHRPEMRKISENIFEYSKIPNTYCTNQKNKRLYNHMKGHLT